MNPRINQQDHTEELIELTKLLTKQNVARGERVILHDVNPSIRTGEQVVVLGPHQCGKSTLIPGPEARCSLAF